MMKTDQIFRYSNGTFQPLPRWAQYFLELGWSVGSKADSESRLVMGTVIPVQAFAAVHIVSGLLLNRMVSSQDAADFESRLHHLRIADRGTHINIMRDGRRSSGLLEEVTEEYIKVKMTKGGTRATPLIRSIPIEDAHLVEVSHTSSINVPRRSLAVSVASGYAFRNAVLGRQLDPGSLSSLETSCVIVGNRSRLEAELEHGKLVIYDGGDAIEGTFSDIIHADCSVKPHQSVWTTVYSSRQPDVNVVADPEFVVFDGPEGFLKMRHLWPKRHWIVLLSWESRLLTDAVLPLENEWRMMRGRRIDQKSMPVPPNGVEIIAIQEDREA